jgi:hypothetical protein
MSKNQRRYDTQKPTLSKPQLLFNAEVEQQPFAAQFHSITMRRYPLFALVLTIVSSGSPKYILLPKRGRSWINVFRISSAR